MARPMRRHNRFAQIRCREAAADFAHILAIGMAETGLSPQKTCHRIGLSRSAFYALCDRQILPPLPIVTAFAPSTAGGLRW